jgi:hypothetical protein
VDESMDSDVGLIVYGLISVLQYLLVRQLQCDGSFECVAKTEKFGPKTQLYKCVNVQCPKRMS